MKAFNFRMPPPVAYIISVMFEKGFAIITIPLMAQHLNPGDYGRLDVAVSLIEFIGLVMSFGMGDTLVRFAATAAHGKEQNRCAAELMTGAVLIALVFGVAVQLAVPMIAHAININVSIPALRWALVGATLSALVDMPMVWMRIQGRAGPYAIYMGARSVLQVLAMWLALRAGWGSDGILIANGTAVLAFTLFVAGQMVYSVGLAFSWRALKQIGNYGVPLVFASLAMFALGSCNRWFLSGNVADADIGYLGLATKLALAAPMLLQPFALWWNPRRIAVLSRPGGIEESTWAFGLGYSVLIISALGVALTGPVFIHLALPAAYIGACAYLPFVIGLCFLHELNTLCNTGAFARNNGYSVLQANVAGAITGIAGYALLTPAFGIAGVIAATALGQFVRLCVALWTGYALAPIPYPVVSSTFVFALAAVAIWLAPAPSEPWMRIVWTALSVSAISVTLVAVGLLRIPGSLLPHPLRRYLNAGVS
ncbi:MAG: lipopolysaccharide biosynthesis protein [Hyphomicrobiaceae bacterium]